MDAHEKFPDLVAASKPPSLISINGIGLMLYGRRDYDAETSTFVKTRCLCVFFVPLLALDAWRVANASGGGWLLVGRCGISRLARGWNWLVLVSLLAGAVSIGWQIHTESPEYQAGQRLADARRNEAGNRLTIAAGAYRDVASGGTSHAAAAASALAHLAGEPLGHAPADVQAQVVGVLAGLPAVARVPGTTGEEVAALAESLATTAAAAGPAQPAIALLTAAKPVLPAERLAADRQRILTAANVRNPADAWVATELALAAEQAGDQARCQVLLEPCAAQLGEGEGARILGGIYAGHGKIEESYRLLRPYVMSRLKQLQEADEHAQKVQKEVMHQIFEQLNKGAAGADWYPRYDLADEVGKQRMVQEWVAAKLRVDPAVVAAERRLRDLAPAVAVALDLGIVTIQRAQGFTDQAQRQAELREAERIFIAIRGFAGDTAAYRQWLAQVDYWLGKPDEGRKLLDEVLAAGKRSGESLLTVADVLREVGDMGAARTLVEEAWTSAPDTAGKQLAAIKRSVLATSIDEQITWLERSDPTNGHVVAELPSARGQRAHREGRDDEAKAELTKSLAAWNQLPRSAATLNNAALVARQLYRISGDPAHLRTACSLMDEAHQLMPSNTILLSNLLNGRVALAELDGVGEVIDAKALGRAIEGDPLGYCYSDRAGRTAIIARYAAAATHAGLLADADRLLLMSPRMLDAHQLIRGELVLLRDAQGLKAFAERTAGAEVDLAAQWEQFHEHLAGTRDAQRIAELAVATRRLEQQVAALRPAGKPATLALALLTLTKLRLSGGTFGQEVDLAACLALAEEADRLHHSHAAVSGIVRVLLLRAGLALAAGDPAVAALIVAERRVLTPTQVVLWQAGDGRWRERLAADPDVRRAAALTVADNQADPDDADLWDWALLSAIADPYATTLADQLSSDQALPWRVVLTQRLDPIDASDVIECALFHRLHGDQAKAVAALDAARRRGLPLNGL